MASSPNTLALPSTFLPPPRHPRTDSVQSGRIVVVAYDQSRASDAILDKVIRTGLLQPDDDIRLVHILPQQDFFSSFVSANTVMSNTYDTQTSGKEKTYNEQMMVDAKEDLLMAVAKVLRQHSFQHVKVEVVQGDPKQSLVDYCQSVRPTFMMTGSRGFGKVKGSILGSVSDFLAKNCPCPVMIIKVTDAEIKAREDMSEKKKSIFSNFLANKQ
ncbi:hypothetical protein BJV82DRAFT_628321 [Fennellomyces sp. T-0311]|nr:hypothetical protein BJV82DRAFT_628321 [Fennellomyces sp. T-0311]